MKRLRIARLLAPALLLVLAGCLEFQNGLSLPDGSDSIMDPTLLGDWHSYDRVWDEWRTIRIEKLGDDSKEYVFRTVGRTDPEGPQGIRLVRLGGTEFLDLPYPLSPGSRHILRLRRRGDRIAMDQVSEAFVKEHPDKLQQMRVGEFHRSVRVTASTDELRKFLEENAKNKAVWQTDLEMIFEKCKPGESKHKHTERGQQTESKR